MLNKNILLLSLVINFILGGCMSLGQNNPKGLLLYGSKEYIEKIKRSKIKLKDAEKILCRFIKDKKEFEYYTHSFFIYKDAYVFNTGLNKVKGLNYNTKGVSGIYIDANTGKVDIIKHSKDSDLEILIKPIKKQGTVFPEYRHFSASCQE